MVRNKLKVVALVLLLTFLASTIAFAAPKAVQMSYYEKVKIGMTKKAVDKVLKVKPKKITEDFTRPNTYEYYNKKGDYGIRITYASGKVSCKSLIYGDSKAFLSVYCENYVTKDMAMQTYKGMPLEEAVALFGTAGAETSNEEKSQIIVEWVNEDGSNITAYYNDADGIYNLVYCNSEDIQDSDVAAIYENQ